MNNSWSYSVQHECLWIRDSASTVPAFECVCNGRQASKQCVFVDGQQPGSWPIRQTAGGGRVWLISSPRREHRRGGEVEVRKHPLAGFSPYLNSNIRVSFPCERWYSKLAIRCHMAAFAAITSCWLVYCRKAFSLLIYSITDTCFGYKRDAVRNEVQQSVSLQ